MDAFIETYGIKYEKAVECLAKDREALLAFYDFPAEHWKHLRTTNPIESTFATVRHRPVRARDCLSNKTALTMIFKLAPAAEKSWHRLSGHDQLPKVIIGVKFNDGIEVELRITTNYGDSALNYLLFKVATLIIITMTVHLIIWRLSALSQIPLHFRRFHPL